MSHIRGADRSQVELLPPCVDDFVPCNAPARFIDAYVDGLDLQKLGFVHAQPSATGRPPYHPGDLLKLYLYGYLHRIRSSRRLEAEAGRNLEVMWLLKQLRPDFKTIADFRKDNISAFKPLFKQFNLLCRKWDLFGAELVAIDGCKFKAVNNPKRHYTQEQLNELIEKVEHRIEEYLKELDSQDQQAEGVAGAPSQQQLKEKLELLKKQQGDYETLLGELKAANKPAISLTDAEAVKLKGPQGNHLVGYNVQIAVDKKHHLVAADDVVPEANDRQQLAPMAQQAKEALDVKQLSAAADKGYHSADQLETCEKAGIETFVPEQGTTSGQGKDGKKIFAKEEFRYDHQANVYHCPAGQVLEPGDIGQSRDKQRVLYANRKACAQCELRERCTTGQHRVISRLVNEAVVERAAERMAAAPERMQERKEMVEHVFGTFRMWGHDTFLLKGHAKVRGEFSLSSMVYNIRRVLNIMGVAELLRQLKVVGG